MAAPDLAPLKVAVAGLGTVGAGTIALLAANGDTIAARSGRRIQVVAVSARTRGKDRGIPLDGCAWYDDAAEMARTADVDVVLELIGGSDGPARAVIEAALGAGRHVVTANKALLAVHGTAVAAAAERAGRVVGYEAAVAGGIPIVKALREGLAGNRVDRLYGILNGTCNFILSTMQATGRDFDDILAEAQALGYAEADPGFDIDGVDAAHKLALLAAIAFGTEVAFDAVAMEGIRHVSALDIHHAAELGFTIKLLGIAERTGQGIRQRVHPCLVPSDAAIANVTDVFNAVVAEGDHVGRSVYEGRGAGAGPTASAVVADLMDIASGRIVPMFGVPASHLAAPVVAPAADRVGAYYIRLTVVDRPGVFAHIARILADESVSMESILQHGRAPGETVPVVMTVHETTEATMARTLARIGDLAEVVETPRMMRIERL